MKDRPSMLKTLSLLWFMTAAALCLVVLFVTPEQIATMFNIDTDQVSRYGFIGKFVGNHLLEIDTIVSKVILTTVIIITWAAGRFAILCASGLANMTSDELSWHRD